jgi:hypothetical protein
MKEVIEKDSTVIQSWHYDYELETLTLRFKNGTVYEYYDVAESTYNAFAKADSLGEFFNSEIKGVYAYCRVK